MSINRVFIICGLLIILTACQPPVSQAPAISDGHHARTSLDWAGVYQGTLPCASCPGIKTLITINPSGEFIKQEHYINTQGSYIERGQIQWQDDGTIIHLTGDDVGSVNYYKVVENALVHLNADKQVIGGDMAEFYRLEKTTMTLENNSWQLTEAVDKSFKAEALNQVSLTFTEQGRLTGQAPCNRFFADYQQSENTLTIGTIGSTKMACEYLKVEQAFFTQLAKVDNYEIKQTILLLKQGEEVLLSFKATFEPNK